LRCVASSCAWSSEKPSQAAPPQNTAPPERQSVDGAFGARPLRAPARTAVYTSYDIFKGKSAANFKVIPPTFTQLGSALTLKKAGAVLLECAPGSQRTYDWSSKVSMALSVNEIAEARPAHCRRACAGSASHAPAAQILAFTGEAGSQVEFVHDPSIGTPTAGQTVKSLRISPMPDGKGLFVNLTQRDKGGANSAISVPVSWGEFAALRTLFEFSIPRLLGWDRALAEAIVLPQ